MKLTVEYLESLGFDESRKSTAGIHVSCSQCVALVINGVPCHETGCPNEMFECEGCDTLINYHGYCEDCQ